MRATTQAPARPVVAFSREGYTYLAIQITLLYDASLPVEFALRRLRQVGSTKLNLRDCVQAVVLAYEPRLFSRAS